MGNGTGNSLREIEIGVVQQPTAHTEIVALQPDSAMQRQRRSGVNGGGEGVEMLKRPDSEKHVCGAKGP